MRKQIDDFLQDYNFLVKKHGMDIGASVGGQGDYYSIMQIETQEGDFVCQINWDKNEGWYEEKN